MSQDKLIFVTEKYFSCNNSVVAAQRAFRLYYNIKRKKAVPSRKVILRCAAKANMQLLREKFKGRLISKFGNVWWPPRSPDLTVPDFYLWGYLKDTVYKNKPQSIIDLKRNIREEIRTILTEILKNVINSLPRRMEACIKSNGKHLNDVIFKK